MTTRSTSMAHPERVPLEAPIALSSNLIASQLNPANFSRSRRPDFRDCSQLTRSGESS